MLQDELKALQAPLKERYREDAATALVTLSATGDLTEGLTCSVQTGRALVEAGLQGLERDAVARRRERLPERVELSGRKEEGPAIMPALPCSFYSAAFLRCSRKPRMRRIASAMFSLLLA